MLSYEIFEDIFLHLHSGINFEEIVEKHIIAIH